MLKNLYKIRVLFFLILTVFLCQCTQTANLALPLSTSHKVKTPYPLPTATYLAMAKKQEGYERQNSLLKAAGRLIDDGQWRQGTAILAQTSNLAADQKNEKKLLMAKVDMMRDNAKAALVQLASISSEDSLSFYSQIQFHELFAQAHRAQGNFTESVVSRIKLEPLLKDNESKMQNLRDLWLTLSHLPQAELDTMAAESASESELQGWLQLALISRKNHDNAKALLSALEQWQMRFSSHPANYLLPNSLDSIANQLISQPKQVALLLPLSGPLNGPGKAIRDGFMASFNEHDGGASTKVKVYDTAVKKDIAEIYQQAITDGADYVVGPLTKSHVASIAALEHPVPTLLLNDADIVAQSNSYLFGLSPSNQATQVAIKARSKGHSRALVIAPKNDWGQEVTKAFTETWKEKGGQVVGTLSYSKNEELNQNLREFLHIDNSKVREKELKNLLGKNVQTSMSRRQDFDMIFLLAYPSKARQIMPLLRYYYAGDIPVYATSSVYGGSANALKDKDLDGIIFCDIPWVFSHQMESKNWPEQFNSYSRLYAMGMDSYALATQLNQLILFPADGSKYTSGILYLKPTKQVARVLEWGQFRQGLAHSLG